MFKNNTLFKFSIINNLFQNLFREFWTLGGIYIIWIVMHYICAHSYVYWCTPASIEGFISTPFLVMMPHCQAMRWCITNGADAIHTMWIIIGSWGVAKLIQV